MAKRNGGFTAIESAWQKAVSKYNGVRQEILKNVERQANNGSFHKASSATRISFRCSKPSTLMRARERVWEAR
jgi:hypothetical protein